MYQCTVLSFCCEDSVWPEESSNPLWVGIGKWECHTLVCIPDENSVWICVLLEGPHDAAEGEVLNWPSVLEELVHVEGHAAGAGCEAAEFCQLQARVVV